jgi:hypothetical protein
MPSNGLNGKTLVRLEDLSLFRQRVDMSSYRQINFSDVDKFEFVMYVSAQKKVG